MHMVQAKGILSAKNGMNIYRGCTHGCIYCDARSDCYNMTHAFEDVEVKQNAPQLLEQALKAKRRRCMIGTGAMSDPYLHAEKELRLTRSCLELIERYGFGLAIQTKSDLIMRDIDLIDSINRRAKAVVQMTLTTADEDLCRIVEPNVCTTKRRFEVLCEMHERGIHTVIWLSPLLPYINDAPENVAAIVDMAGKAGCMGIICFDMGLTLRSGDREHYYSALERRFPGLRERYIREYGDAYMLTSPKAAELWRVFISECRSRGIEYHTDAVFDFLQRFEESEQLTLF